MLDNSHYYAQVIDFQAGFNIYDTIGLVQFIGLCLAFFVPRRFI